ncbi:NAD(P)H-binding protein [Streptomyces sp. NPDC003860]
MSRLDATTLADLLHGTDVLVFAAGAARAGGEGGTAGTTAIGGTGLTTTIEAARRAGVHRLLLVSVFP